MEVLVRTYLSLIFVQVLRPPMQRGDYPMFIFTSHRKPLASDDLVRSANLSESLIESTGTGLEPESEPEKPQNSVANVSAISCSPPPEEYVVL